MHALQGEETRARRRPEAKCAIRHPLSLFGSESAPPPPPLVITVLPGTSNQRCHISLTCVDHHSKMRMLRAPHAAPCLVLLLCLTACSAQTYLPPTCLPGLGCLLEERQCSSAGCTLVTSSTDCGEIVNAMAATLVRTNGGVTTVDDSTQYPPGCSVEWGGMTASSMAVTGFYNADAASAIQCAMGQYGLSCLCPQCDVDCLAPVGQTGIHAKLYAQTSEDVPFTSSDGSSFTGGPEHLEQVIADAGLADMVGEGNRVTTLGRCTCESAGCTPVPQALCSALHTAMASDATTSFHDYNHDVSQAATSQGSFTLLSDATFPAGCSVDAFQADRIDLYYNALSASAECSVAQNCQCLCPKDDDSESTGGGGVTLPSSTSTLTRSTCTDYLCQHLSLAECEAFPGELKIARPAFLTEWFVCRTL